MRYGIVINAGDPREMADLAGEAEAASWDGVFYYDAIAIGDAQMYDPWVVLAAMAMRTKRLTLGLIVAAPSRRRPWKLARETMTVDVLSNRRLVLPVGIGALDDQGYGNVGEVTDSKARAERLDETLAILDGLWSGEPFGFDGRHFSFGPMTFRPTPVQRPRIPIWVVGVWGKARTMRRFLRWDDTWRRPVLFSAASIEGLLHFAGGPRDHGANSSCLRRSGMYLLRPTIGSLAVRPGQRCSLLGAELDGVERRLWHEGGVLLGAELDGVERGCRPRCGRDRRCAAIS
jgi:hypothetical protein